MTIEQIKYKTGLRRLGAAIIDAVVFVPLIFADNFIRDNLNNKIGLLLWLIFYLVISFFYTVFMHNKYGQTVGKMATKIKVLTLDESRNLSIRQALLRDSFYILLDTVGLIYFIIQLIRADSSTTELLDSFDNFVGSVALVWVLLELVSMLTNKKRRAIHDFIAGSVVIKTDRNNS